MNEELYLTRMRRRWAAAEAMIGELSNGKFYIFPVGGEYLEGTYEELFDYVIRRGLV